MKAELTTKNKRGFSIIEVLIAIAVLTLGISAVILLAFANQTLKTDRLTQIEAVGIAKKMVESARASSRGDFISVQSIPASQESIYSKTRFISQRHGNIFGNDGQIWKQR